jgi:hypothetical protein
VLLFKNILHRWGRKQNQSGTKESTTAQYQARNKASANKLAAKEEAKCQLAAQGIV